MSKQANREDVSLSFHYIKRVKPKKDGKKNEKEAHPFTAEDFDSLFEGLEKQRDKDIENKDFLVQLRRRNQATIEAVEKEGKFISGIYGNAYSGHEYENTEHGTISADSLNIKPFFFQLYLSDNGEIFVTSQYLGNYGGYTTLASTIYYLLGDSSNLKTVSFNTNRAYAVDGIPTEVEVSYSKKGSNIEADNSYGQAGVFAFRKPEGDDSFSQKVRDDFFSLFSKEEKDRKKEIARIMADHNLYEITEEDIDDCKILAKVNKRTRTIQIFDSMNRASRFPVEIEVDKSGHPPYNELKLKAKDLLKNEIIAVR